MYHILLICSVHCADSCLFFFFQAEDGIRDVAVTGVQTCALPISSRSRREKRCSKQAKFSSAATFASKFLFPRSNRRKPRVANSASRRPTAPPSFNWARRPGDGSRKSFIPNQIGRAHV